MLSQTTDTLVMIRPKRFRANEQTMTNNYFQKKETGLSRSLIEDTVLKEFDSFVKKLNNVDINVIVIPDDKDTDTPDAMFLNNWISFHENCTVAVYPMFAKNRRLERREDILEVIENSGFLIDSILDYTEAEDEGMFLEGTGSMVLDRTNKKAYCCLSERTNEELFIEFCEDFEYSPIIFNANQMVNGSKKAIYHTNIMMCIGESFAIVCLDVIDDTKERKNVIRHLRENKKQIIEISEEQLYQFAGNMLQVKNKKNDSFLVMSKTAFNSLSKQQLNKINNHTTVLYSDLSTIEKNGGGSARCMIAEVFLPQKSTINI